MSIRGVLYVCRFVGSYTYVNSWGLIRMSIRGILYVCRFVGLTRINGDYNFDFILNINFDYKLNSDSHFDLNYNIDSNL